MHLTLHSLRDTLGQSHAAIPERFLPSSLVLVLLLLLRLASAGIAFGLDHLFIDPIMTLLFGNTQFYRSRGYYYNG